MRKVRLLPLLAALALSGCYSDEEIEKAESVITALPTEIAGCVFLGNVDTVPLGTIDQARFQLQYYASRLGATHLVETHAYAGAVAYTIIGVALSGRAYRCPPGKGPLLPDPASRLTFTQQEAHTLYPDPPFGYIH